MDPISFLRYLETLGSIVSITTLDDALPKPEEMNPEICYLGFEINFNSDAERLIMSLSLYAKKARCVFCRHAAGSQTISI